MSSGTAKSATNAKKPIQMQRVDSTSISSQGYDPESKILAVKFVAGDTYHYLDVSDDVYRRFVESDSMGRFMAQHIRNKYKTIKIGAPDEHSMHS